MVPDTKGKNDTVWTLILSDPLLAAAKMTQIAST